MIYEVSGDILLTQADVIAQGVAANDPMSEGLAMSLHETFPSMHKAYHQWCHKTHPKSGDAWIWGDKKTNGVRIVNLISQDGGYGKGARPEKATVKNISHALRALKKMVKKEKILSIALPAIATGVGGLNWADVKPVIEQQLGDLKIPVYVYVDFKPGKKAVEPTD